MARKMNQTPGAPPQLTPRQMEEQMRLQQGAPPGQGYPGQPPHKSVTESKATAAQIHIRINIIID